MNTRKKIKEVKVKQIELYEFLGIKYLMAVSEDGALYTTAIGSGEWTKYPAPSLITSKKK